MKTLKLVIAGNYKEFKYYFPKPDKNIIYVDSVRQIRGACRGEIIKVGTWYERPDIYELEQESAIVRFHIRRPPRTGKGRVDEI